LNKELVINSTSSGVEIALLEDKRLVELHYDNDDQYAVGDLYLGKVKKIASGLNAVFVDIGHSKDAFLHYTDLSPQYKTLQKFTKLAVAHKGETSYDFSTLTIEPEILKTGKINDVIKTRDEVLVQILKEPISSKGPRISCEITLPGRFIVLSPFNNFVTVSRKISSVEERKRLQRIIEAIKPKNFGVIVRTAAEGQSTAELHQDLLDLVASWTTMLTNLQKAAAPFKILSEKNKTTSILRDLLTGDFNAISSNDENIVEEAKLYIGRIAPDKMKIISQYKNTQPIFDFYGISKQVKSSFGKTVMLPTGGYLIIERTEAMHVVDVNSGHKIGKESQEETSLSTNIYAAKELARQLRLRDMGGIIIVDFIDMRNPDHKKVLFNEMENAMSTDRARHSILQISKFGLMQITRQRLRPEIEINTGETCPSCAGTGAVRSTVLITDDIEHKLTYIVKQGSKDLSLHVNPILYSHFTKSKGFFGVNNLNKEWNKKLNARIKIVEEPHYELIAYTIHDTANGDEIKM
jgi:ribonuclease G